MTSELTDVLAGSTPALTAFLSKLESSMITITRSYEWDAAHRVLGHESKCKHLHGHRYKAELEVTAYSLDVLGRVIDFGVIKDIAAQFIDQNWDHNIMLNSKDPLALIYKDPLAFFLSGSVKILSHQQQSIFSGKAPYIFSDGRNPTAENIAHELWCILDGEFKRHSQGRAFIRRIRVYETPNCWADCSYPAGTES